MLAGHHGHAYALSWGEFHSVGWLADCPDEMCNPDHNMHCKRG